MSTQTMKVYRHITYLLLTILLISGISCGRKAAENPNLKQVSVVRGIQTEKAELRPVDDSYEVTGTVRSRTVTNISSRVSATVTSIKVREGELVKAGQILVELDSRESKNGIDQAEAALKRAMESANEADQSIATARGGISVAEANRRLAESTFGRYRELFERKSVSPQEYDEVKARFELATNELARDSSLLQVANARKAQAQVAVEQARGEVSRAKIASTYYRISSPSSGIVSAKFAEAGSVAMPGSPLLTIEDSSNYRLEVQVEESRSAAIHSGDKADVRVDAIAGYDFKGRVVEVVPSSDQQSHTFTAKLEIPYRQGLRSGLFGSARLVGTGKGNAITIPLSSVITRGQMETIFVADSSGILHQRLIRTGKRFGNRVEVLSGIAEGERVVVSGAEKLSEGNRIE